MTEASARGSIPKARLGSKLARSSRPASSASPARGKLQVLAASISDPGEGRSGNDSESKRQQEAARNVMAGRNAVSTEMGGKGDFSTLQERINSGEFGSAGGSKKERLTRPLRRALAKDRVGPGMSGEFHPNPEAQ